MSLCDTHIHVVGDPARYPMIPSRTYTPPPARIEELQALAAPHGIRRFVVVQPSFYGTDNTLVLEALEKLGANGAGVAVVDPNWIGPAELERLHAAGVRGLRINLYSTHGIVQLQGLADRFMALAGLARRMDWHVQVIAPIEVLTDAADVLAGSPVPVVIDHYGLPGTYAPDSATGLKLLRLVRQPHVWVKLSAPYRSSRNELEIVPRAPWLGALLRAAPDRCVWGSDWPFTPAHEAQPGSAGPAPYRAIDYGALVATFRAALPAKVSPQAVMGSNAARLYGFEH